MAFAFMDYMNISYTMIVLIVSLSQTVNHLELKNKNYETKKN